MAKNRKNESAAVRFGPALKALVLCVFIGGSGVGYVGQKSQLHILGTQLKERETRLSRLQRDNNVRTGVLDSLQSLPELDARVKQMNLGLFAPPLDQIVRLVERLPDTSGKSVDRLYVEHASPATRDHP